MQTNLINPLGPKLILASRSPRRVELLTLVGARFTTFPVDVDESALPGERPDAHVQRLAEAKARAAAEARGGNGADDEAVVVGADTIVSLDRAILGKPSGPEEAARMLERLSGRIHEVWTGLFLLDPVAGRAVGGALRSIVKFAPLDADDVARYVATGEPLDKAGAYAVQGKGAVFVEAIEGSYSNVVGLPLSYLKHLLGLLVERAGRV
ncbi:MAG TPA: Maf family protein [Candidatus Eisenbacteria bacterium]|nr:Maf family protein [Candidatus Eisenbacteria bacterium]